MERLIRTARVLGRGAYVLAWVLLISAVLLVGLERGPWLREVVNERLARELGALAPHFSVDDVHVRWLDGTLELEGVRFERPGGGLFLNRVRIALDLFGAPGGGPRVRNVEITGGRLGLYQEVLDDLSELIKGSPELASAPAGRDMSGLPRLVIRDVHVDFHTPRFGVVPVGEVDLYFEADGALGSSLHGRLRPSLAVPGAEAPVYFSGTLGDELLTLRTAARGVRLGTRHLGRAAFLELLPVIDPAADVRLNGELVLPLDGSAPPRARARLAILDASFTPRADLPAVEGFALELDTTFEPGPGQGLYTTRAWSMAGSLEGNWLGTPVSGWMRAGRSAPSGSALEGWVRLPAFPTGQETLAVLLRILGNTRARDAAQVYWAMLEPKGSADVLLGLSVPNPFDPPEHWRWLADVQLDGGLEVAWHGLPPWRNRRFDPADERYGVPVPISDLRGRLVYARDPARPRADLAGLVDVSGVPRGVSEESARGQIRGVLGVPVVPGWGLDLELDVRMPPVVMDELLLADLDAMPATRSIARDYAPLGGTIEVQLGIQSNERTRGALLALDIAFRDGTMAWKEIPVRVRGMNGHLACRWTLARDGVQTLNKRPSRPLGVRFDAGGSFGVGERQRVAVAVAWREEATDDPPRTAVNARGETYLLNPSALSVRVDLDDLSLSGDDFQVLRDSQPELARVTREFAPKGWVDLSYETAQETPNGAGRWEAEVHPGRVELLPAVFPVPTRDVRGRVIVRGHFPDRDEEAPGPPPTAVRLDLEGIWQAGGVDVAASGVKLPGRDGEATLFAAGVDPSNRSFLGSIADVVAAGRGNLDLSALAVGGTLDFTGVLPLVDVGSAPDDVAGGSRPLRSSETPGEHGHAGSPPRFRVYLRDNELVVNTLRLTGMRGVLEQEAGELQSARIDAFMASTPVRLEGARFLDADALERHPETARLLEDMGVAAGAGSYVFLAKIAALRPIPLDEEHLSLFFEGEALKSVLGRLGLRGRLRFDELSIAVTGDGRGRGQVGLRGPVAVEDAYVLLGLPIEFDSGDLDLHSLVLEAGRLRGWVDLVNVDGAIADRSIRDTSMTLTYVDGRLSIDDLEAHFDFGGADDGTLTSLGGGGGRALAIDLADPYRFDLALEARRARLSGLLEGLFDSDIREPGLLDGRLVIAGSPDHLTKIQGGGRMELYDARLWSVPVARKLFSSLGMDDTATFQEMSAGFDIEGGVVTMHNMRAASPLLKLVGDGTVDMDGRLAIDLEVRYSLVDKLGPLTQLLYAFQDLILHGIAVRGDMNRPIILLRNALREVFMGFDEDQRYLPVPLFQPFPERF